MNVLVVNASPRRDGNSARLALASAEGAREAGHVATLVHLDDHLQHFLRDCRRCRDEHGRCTIEDGYERLLRDHVIPAEAMVLATPLYWYGVSGQLKTFFDRMFCFISASQPDSEHFVSGLSGKRLAVLIAAEETYPGAALAVTHQIQEYARYTHSALVGMVRGIGNKRGDVELDPSDPLHAARELGRTLADRHSTDYRIDTDRPASTWPSPTVAG
ncbi:MAG: flavodoxin family protein [Solirubrobacteraceae bacterium]